MAFIGAFRVGLGKGWKSFLGGGAGAGMRLVLPGSGWEGPWQQPCPSRAVPPALSSGPLPSTPSSFLAPVSACKGSLAAHAYNTKPSCSHFKPGIRQSEINPR